MAKKEITITIDHATGEQTIEGENFEGATCSAELAKFMAGRVISDKKKPEYYKVVKAGQKVGK